MKRFFAALVIFSALASGVYAEISVSGSVGGGVTFLKGTNLIGDVLQTGNYLSGSLEAEGVDENDTFGGIFQINAEASTVDPAAWAWSASAWWKPFYFMKLQAGYLDSFALTEIVGWGYHANDAESFAVSPKNNYAGDYFSDTTGFYNGTGNGWIGFTLSVTPIYGLDINIGVPFGRSSPRIDPQSSTGEAVTDPLTGKTILIYKASDTYLYTSAQIAYTLWGVGRLALSFTGGGDGQLHYLYEDQDEFTDYTEYDPTNDTDPDGIRLYMMDPHSHSLYASFLLTAFEDKGFSLNLGFAYTLPAKSSNGLVIYYPPMEAGMGISFGTGKFGIKTRMAASFMGTTYRTAYGIHLASDNLYEPLMLGFGILPYINFGPLTLYLNAGVSYKWEDEVMREDGSVFKVPNSAALGWHANPYMTAAIGSGKFYFGLWAESDGLKYTGYNKDIFTITKPGSTIEEYPGVSIVEWGVAAGILFEF